MQEAPSDASVRRELLAELGERLEMPVIALVSGWHGDKIVDLGEEAARVFVEVLDAELAARSETPDTIALFVDGRGGLPTFAEAVWRALQGRDLRLCVVVPYRVDGIFSILGLAADTRLFHPYGGMGAYDRAPLRRRVVEMDAHLMGAVDDSSRWAPRDPEALAALAWQRRQAQLAGNLVERIVGGTDKGLGARVARELGAQRLGSDLALSAAELTGLGLESRIADEAVAELIWRLHRAYETELEVLEPATPRYTQSEVADEVEFEPAMGVTGALIEAAARDIVFELDTGRPDPDTGVLHGEWIWEALDLDDLI